jgi:hypothetical protein
VPTTRCWRSKMLSRGASAVSDTALSGKPSNVLRLASSPPIRVPSSSTHHRRSVSPFRHIATAAIAVPLCLRTLSSSYGQAGGERWRGRELAAFLEGRLAPIED